MSFPLNISEEEIEFLSRKYERSEAMPALQEDKKYSGT